MDKETLRKEFSEWYDKPFVHFKSRRDEEDIFDFFYQHMEEREKQIEGLGIHMEIQTIKVTEEESNLLHEFAPEIWPVLLMEMDFNRLMPVVEKINTIDISEFNYDAMRMSQFRLMQEAIQQFSITTPIRVIYPVLVIFIKWYNTKRLIG